MITIWLVMQLLVYYNKIPLSDDMSKHKNLSTYLTYTTFPNSDTLFTIFITCKTKKEHFSTSLVWLQSVAKHCTIINIQYLWTGSCKCHMTLTDRIRNQHFASCNQTSSRNQERLSDDISSHFVNLLINQTHFVHKIDIVAYRKL